MTLRSRAVLTLVLTLSGPALPVGAAQPSSQDAAGDRIEAGPSGGAVADGTPRVAGDVASVGSDDQRGLPGPPPALPRTGEWQIGVGIAWSVPVYNARPDINYGIQTVSWTHEVTADRGPGPLRGRLALGVEALPALVEASPSTVYGAGIAPVLVRWNFVPRRRWSAFTEVAGGLLGTSSAIPDGTARFNFTAHLVAALRLAAGRGRAIVAGYRFEHISNGDRLATNPGINSHGLVVGWSAVGRAR